MKDTPMQIAIIKRSTNLKMLFISRLKIAISTLAIENELDTDLTSEIFSDKLITLAKIRAMFDGIFNKTFEADYNFLTGNEIQELSKFCLEVINDARVHYFYEKYVFNFTPDEVNAFINFLDKLSAIYHIDFNVDDIVSLFSSFFDEEVKWYLNADLATDFYNIEDKEDFVKGENFIKDLMKRKFFNKIFSPFIRNNELKSKSFSSFTLKELWDHFMKSNLIVEIYYLEDGYIECEKEGGMIYTNFSTGHTIEVPYHHFEEIEE